MGNLGKRLKRELVKSPGKSAALALVSAVAIWYWAPLIGSWLSGNPTQASENLVVSPNSVSAAETMQPAASEAPADDPAPAKKTYSWRTLVKWLDRDVIARSASLAETWRDPFRPEKTEDAANEPMEPGDIVDGSDEPPDAAAKATIDLAQLPLELGGTICGARHRWATINGRTYREGDVIAVQLGGRDPKASSESDQIFAVILEAVHPRHVILAWRAERRRLELETAGLAAGDQIARRSQ